MDYITFCRNYFIEHKINLFVNQPEKLKELDFVVGVDAEGFNEEDVDCQWIQLADQKSCLLLDMKKYYKEVAPILADEKYTKVFFSVYSDQKRLPKIKNFIDLQFVSNYRFEGSLGLKAVIGKIFSLDLVAPKSDFHQEWWSDKVSENHQFYACGDAYFTLLCYLKLKVTKQEYIYIVTTKKCQICTLRYKKKETRCQNKFCLRCCQDFCSENCEEGKKLVKENRKIIVSRINSDKRERRIYFVKRRNNEITKEKSEKEQSVEKIEKRKKKRVD